MDAPTLPTGWRWRAGRAGPDEWQAERLADSQITACAYNPSYPASEAHLLDVAAPVRARCHLPPVPVDGFPADVLDAGFVPLPERPHWLTLPGVHPGLTITGADYGETTARARRYLAAVAEGATERAKQPNKKPHARARQVKQVAKAQKPAPAAVAASEPVQMGFEL